MRLGIRDMEDSMTTIPNPVAFRSQDLMLHLRRPAGPFTSEAALRLSKDESVPARLRTEDIPNLDPRTGILGAHLWAWYHLAAIWPDNYNAWGGWSTDFMLAVIADALNPPSDPTQALARPIVQDLFQAMAITAGERHFEGEQNAPSFQHTNAAEALAWFSNATPTELNTLGCAAQCTELLSIVNRFATRGEPGRKPIERFLLDLRGHWFLADRPRTDFQNTWRKP